MIRYLRALVGAILLIAGVLGAGPALADHIVVKRHVTMREAPSRTSDVVTFPEIGTALELLDDGARQRGYYHIVLPDGRRGWIYYTFVERRPGDPPGFAVVEPLVPADAGQMAVHYIDVDQGASALLEFPCGAILIDAGGRGTAASDHLIEYLDRFFARRSDLNRRLSGIYVTHTHVDHNSNLRRVAERYSVGGYVHNGILTGSGRVAARWMDNRTRIAPAIPTAAVTQAMVAAAGAAGLGGAVIDPLACAGVDPRIRILSGAYTENPGWPDGEYENGNNQSLVIRVDYGETSFLFTGDMEETAIETLVDRYAANQLLDVNVYAVGHHGSHNGTTQELLDAMTPEMAVISMGASTVQQPWTAWAYGHPRRDVVTALVGSVSSSRPVSRTVRIADRVKRFSEIPMSRAVYATGWDGDIVISANSAGIQSVALDR